MKPTGYESGTRDPNSYIDHDEACDLLRRIMDVDGIGAHMPHGLWLEAFDLLNPPYEPPLTAAEQREP